MAGRSRCAGAGSRGLGEVSGDGFCVVPFRPCTSRRRAGWTIGDDDFDVLELGNICACDVGISGRACVFDHFSAMLFEEST